MNKPTLLMVPVLATLLASCTPPPDVPPPHFQPDPPFAPEPVDPYLQGLVPSQDVAPVPPQAGPYAPPLPRMDSPAGAPSGQATIPERPKDYPVAATTDRPNIVRSPYPPYDEIDVSDFRSGQLARDPKNKQIFRVP